MPVLYLLRHAKSSWDDPGLDDHDRPLAPRGRRAARQLAEHLQQESTEPDLVLCSSARRTIDTLDAIRKALGENAAIVVEDDLYGASESDLLARLKAVPADSGSVMLIGHNPGIQYLAVMLAAGGEKLDRIRRKYPTAALATLSFGAGWAQLEPGAAVLEAFWRP
jgi:phosphohistidine phosphatase